MSVARRLGRYRIGERIGTGGVADVYRAQVEGAAGFAKTVVVKCLRPHVADEPDLVDALAREAKLAQRLHHGNIVQVFDFGVEQGQPYVVMEHVDGCSLHELLRDLTRRQEPMALEEALFVAEELAAALRYVHGVTDDEGSPLRLVHRDVKPRNVLVSREGVVKLTDFGIAKVAGDRDDTLPGVIKGTPAYLAPEQALSRGVDARTDVFALGLVVRDLLGEGLSEHPSPDPRIDAALRAIYERATHDEPAQRYDDVSALLRALQRWRSDHGLEAHPGRLAAWVRRARQQAPIAKPVSLDAALLGDVPSESLDETLDEPEPHTRAGPVPTSDHPTRLRRGLLAAMAAFAVGAVAWVTMAGGPTGDPRPSAANAPPQALADDAPRDELANADPSSVDSSSTDPSSIDPSSTNPSSADPSSANLSAADTASPDPSSTDTASADPSSPDTSSTDPAPTAAPPPTASSSGPADSTATEPGPPPDRTTRPGSRPPPEARTGRLVVNLLPWAEVTVDGRALGRVPVDVELSAGRHRVRLYNPQLGETIKTIELRAGQTTTLNKW